MPEYNILFLDIDGTILQPDHTIQDSTKAAIAQVKEKGLEVFLATGRPLHEIYDLAEQLDIHSFIGYNGAFAIHKGKEVLNEPMNPNTIQYYLDVANRHGHEMVLYTNNRNTFTKLHTPSVNQFIDCFDLKQNELFTNDVIEKILGITLMNLSKEDPSLYRTEENIYFSPVNVAGLDHCYDVIRENVNKGNAVQSVLELLHLSPENAIAFGDGMNDKEMLRFVGEGFAMENGHPELFSYANQKTTAVTDSGIFNGLKKLGLVK